MDSQPAPRYSDDGMWMWDGQQWVPNRQLGPSTGSGGVSSRYAGFWRRFAASLIDTAILLIAIGVMSGLLNAFASGLDSAQTSNGAWSAFAGLAIVLIVLVGPWLYFSLQESSPRQATLGKLAIGVHVIDLRGRRLSFARATGRNFAKILSGLFCYVGYLIAGFSQRKQALHDMIAGTLVVQGRANPTQPVLTEAQLGPTSANAGLVIASIAAGVGVLLLTSIMVIVILLTMGGQIKNVFSNVVVALNS